MIDNESAEPTESTAGVGSRGDDSGRGEPAAVRSARRSLPGSTGSLPTVSLELFPPRPGRAASATWGRIDRLLATGPDFVSVTYRPTFVTEPAPGPTERDRGADRLEPVGDRGDDTPRVRAVQEETNPSEGVLAHVLESSTIPLMAHLTCIGYRKQEAVDIVTRFLRMGVRRFLALRGDPPAGTRADDVAGELRHADDLVRVIREVEADFFGDGRRHVTIAVAAYPATSDHIEAIEVLAAKQAAGADLAITQVFYDPADYVALTNAASYAGVSIPILPGVIPLTDLRRLTRLEALTGVKVPEGLRSSLGSASGAALVERGIGATLDLATALLRAGAPGLHLYTFNRTRPALDVISHLRLGGILAGAAPDREVRDAVDRGYLQATPGRGPSFLRCGSPGAAASSRHPVQPHTTITKENA
ncbi:methylenetetrahydrofolate reductase [Actinomyces viscosus]|uniref:methylenetetrahydrofolate reductase n=1 Tax=Actinomyces viscosus TaxID=1656 RepID=UPI0028E2DEC3|nr:methylenetetrahydrofolate reductase [Actinomyces viscosus]